MAFLPFPMKFEDYDEQQLRDFGIDISDPDEDQLKTYNIKPKIEDGVLYINTEQICAYNGRSDGNTSVRMANGEIYPLHIKAEVFTELLARVDSIIDIEKFLQEN